LQWDWLNEASSQNTLGVPAALLKAYQKENKNGRPTPNPAHPIH
jgi:hypothetical protein